MMHEHRRLYILPPITSIMERKPISSSGMPIENLPSVFLPANTGVGKQPCTICGVRITQSINLAGCDGGHEFICVPCYTLFCGDDGQPLGTNQTLHCGCIISNVKLFNHDWHVHLCTHHLITVDPVIQLEKLVDDGYRNCSSCGELQLENEFILKGKILCKVCYSDLYCIGCGLSLDEPRIDNGCLVCMGGA